MNATNAWDFPNLLEVYQHFFERQLDRGQRAILYDARNDYPRLSSVYTYQGMFLAVSEMHYVNGEHSATGGAVRYPSLVSFVWSAGCDAVRARWVVVVVVYATMLLAAIRMEREASS